ncbi:hypothetical protein ABEB36_010520 [Hypothenemus hampei]|uniref:Uncharacterized protein n=1 Tax=Hypothenemus hampei TaxID=57062 RepID=A0ABD1EKJ9_HYPHA
MYMSTFGIGIIIAAMGSLLSALLVIVLILRSLSQRKKNFQIDRIEEEINIPSPRKQSTLEILNVYRGFQRTYSNENNDNCHENFLDSTDFTSKFTNSLLRLNSDADETLSSTGSLKTCYSATISRSNSKTTFISCSEGSGDEEIV